jgi:iron(III) transport system permease protein
MNFLLKMLSRLPQKSTWGMLAVGAFLTYLIIPPLFFLFKTSFTSGDTMFGTPTLGLENYSTVLNSASTWQLLINSLTFAIGSSIVGLTIGGVLAWIVERTNTPFRKLVYVAVFLHFATPGILRVIGWILLIGPKSGYINVLLRKFLSLDVTTGPLNIFSMPGMIMIEGLIWGSLVFLLMSAPLRSMDPALEEAAAISGAGVLETIWKVTLPMALPSILSVLLLAFVRCLEAFEVPALIGVPAGVHVFTTKIYFEIKRDIFPNYGIASAYSILTLVLVGFGLFLYSRATRASYKFYTITGKGYRPKVTDLGKWRYLTMLIIFILPLFDLLPLLMLAWSSFLPFHMAPSFEALSKFTLDNYHNTMGSMRTITSIKNSLIVSSTGATIATLLAMLVAWIAVRTKLRGRWFLDSMASFPLVFPGVVLGVALLKTYLTIPIPVYNTLWILIIGYIIRYLPYAMRYCHPGLLQISSELEESAYICGANWFTTFKKVLIPLMLPALFGAWIWIFLVSFRELSLSIMLSGPTTPVVAVSIFELWENGQVSEVGAFGVMLSGGLMLLSVIFHKFIKTRGVERSDKADI